MAAVPTCARSCCGVAADALGTKKLVIWMMTARDLYNYWEEWEPLSAK